MAEETIKTQQTVFDLESKDNVTIFKSGTFSEVASNQEALTRLGNDASQFLKALNIGLRQLAIDALAANSDPWKIEDEEGTVSDFNGTTLNEVQSKFLAGMVLNMAKMSGYAKDKPRQEKKALKEKALENILAMPGFVENLKQSKTV